jgi:DNA-binding transcriptional LysR family regulator
MSSSVTHPAVGRKSTAIARRKIRSSAAEWHTIAALVGAGFGLSVAPASVSQLRLKSVKYVPLRTPGTSAMLRLVWRKDAPPTVQRFAQFVAARAE